MVTTFGTSDQSSNHLQRAQQDLQMPFSSPMCEEVLSPTSPDIQYNNPSSSRKGSYGGGRTEHGSSLRQRFSAQKSSRETMRQKKDKSPNRARLAGLNVVTNFSKPPVSAQRAAKSDPQQNVSNQMSVDEHQSQATLLPNRAYSGPKKRAQGMEGANNDNSKGHIEGQRK